MLIVILDFLVTLFLIFCLCFWYIGFLYLVLLSKFSWYLYFFIPARFPDTLLPPMTFHIFSFLYFFMDPFYHHLFLTACLFFFGSRCYFFFWAFKRLCHFDDNRSFFIKNFMALFALTLQRILSVTPERTVKLVTQSTWGKHHNRLIVCNFLMSIMHSFCKNSWTRTW